MQVSQACPPRETKPFFELASSTKIATFNPEIADLSIQKSLNLDFRADSGANGVFSSIGSAFGGKDLDRLKLGNEIEAILKKLDPNHRVGPLDGGALPGNLGTPNRAAPPGAPQLVASYSNALSAEIANAVVLVHGVTTTGVAELATCNGVYLGNNRVLTSGHCVSSPDASRFIVEFGELDSPELFATTANLLGEERCKARTEFMPPATSASPGLDYAILVLEETPSPRFGNGLSLDASFQWTSPDYDVSEGWPGDDPKVPAAAQLLALAQVWLPDINEKLGYFASKLLEPAAPGKSSHCFSAIRSGARDACLPSDQRFSSVGEPNGCDAVRGSSGAPYFRRFSASAANAQRIVGIVKSGSSDQSLAWNCAVSSSRICKDLQEHSASNAAVGRIFNAICK